MIVYLWPAFDEIPWISDVAMKEASMVAKSYGPSLKLPGSPICAAVAP